MVARWWRAPVLVLVLATACSGKSVVRGPRGGAGGAARAAAGGTDGGAGGTPGAAATAQRGGTAGEASAIQGGNGGEAEPDRAGTGGDGSGGAGVGGDAGGSGAAGAAGDSTASCDARGIIRGDTVAEGALENLLCATEVHGKLVVRLDDRSPSSLPLLRLVTGDLKITQVEGAGAQPLEFSLPALEQTGDLRLSRLGDVERVRMPALRTIDGQLLVGSCKVEGPSDYQIFSCASNPMLKQVELPSLDTAESVIVGENPELARFDAPLLEQVGELQFGDCLPVENYDLDLYGEESCPDLDKLKGLDFSALGHATTIHLVRPPLLDTLAFPALLTAERIQIEGGKNEATPLVVDLPWLEHTPSLVVHSLNAEWRVPRLASAGWVNFTALSGTTTPSFPALTSFEGLTWDGDASEVDCGTLFPVLPGDAYPELFVSGELTSFQCPEATSAPRIWISGRNLTSIDLSSLTTVGELHVGICEVLTELTLGELVSATDIAIGSNPALLNLSFPRLGPSVDALWFSGNYVLTRVEAPLLTSATTLWARSNSAWSQCDLDAWAATLSTSCDCSENLECP